MKHPVQYPLLAFLSTLLFLGGCANDSKKHGGSGEDGAMPGDSIFEDNVPAARPPGINPETDVDYALFAAETVFFAFDSSSVQASERGKLSKVAEWMASNPDRSLFLAGHADSRGTLEYNRGLGERRSLAVRDYLIGMGVDGGRMHTISYGEERPVDNAENEAAYAKNRRVQIGVIKK
jgi:peptidoglycan-associated lipoprotein